ncbi:hypothetical protein V2J09_009449 [Rumex salicifolius]
MATEDRRTWLVCPLLLLSLRVKETCKVVQKNSSSDVPQRTSPATPRTARQTMSGGSDSSPVPSPNNSRNLKNRSPRTLERSSPKSPLNEKKRMNKVSELECQLAQLKEELKRVKEMLSSFEAQKKQAHQEAEETAKQLSFLSAKLEESQQQLESEARAIEMASEARLQLEAAKANAEAIRSNTLMAMEAYNSLISELEQSKAQAITLENLVTKLQSDLAVSINATSSADCSEDVEINSLKLEIQQLKSVLEASEIRYQEEYIQSTLQIRSAYEAVEIAKSESSLKEAELEQELRKAKDAIKQLQSDLLSKHNKLQYISHEKEELTIKILENHTCIKDSELRVELKKLEVDLTHLKSALLDKESEIESISEENDILRNEISDRETERNRVNEEAVALAQAAKAAEKEALMRLGYATEEADKCNRRATKVVEQLQAAQMENSEMEAQLRRMKVQTDQWRKAAEAAASMLSPSRDAKMVDRTVSLDSRYHTIGMKMDSPFSDIMDYDSPKKKSGNMLRKIGGFWKKSPK